MPKDENGEVLLELDLEPSAPPAGDEGVTDTATPGGEGEHTEPKTEEPASMAEAIEAAFEAGPDGEAPQADEAPKGDEADPEADEPKDGDKPADGEGGEAPSEDPETDGENDELPDDPTEDELKGASPRAQKRIAKLLSERKEARAEADTLRTDADSFRQVRTFMSENDLADADVANLFKAGAALKTGTPEGYRAFLELAGPMVQVALEATGKALPADLRGQVDTGEMTQEAASQVAMSRHATAAAQATATRVTEQRTADQTQATQNQIVTAVSGWMQRTQATDPDYARKADVMKRVTQALVAERGAPQTPEAAVEIAKAAYDEATTVLRSAQPKRPTRPQPAPSASSPRGGVKTAPQTLADIVAAGLGG